MREPELRTLLSRLGIEVVQKTHSGWLHASCPLASWTHGSGTDRRPSFGAKVDDGGISSYYCHGCKMHGRISSLARTLGHFRHGDKDHYRDLSAEADDADRMGLAPGWFDLAHKADAPQEPVAEEVYANMFEPVVEHQDAKAYLVSRGIHRATAESLGLLYDPRQHRVMFPVRGPGGELYGFTGRAVDDATEPKVKDYFGLKKRQHVLGADRWHHDDPGRPLIIVEGLFGLAHLVELNVEAVADVGALMGSALHPMQADVIKRRDTRTFLLSDNDPAGDQFLFGTETPLGERRPGAVEALQPYVPLSLPSWPQGKDDPDQLTKRELWDMLRSTPVLGEGEQQLRWE